MDSMEADLTPGLPKSQVGDDICSTLCTVATLLSIAKALLMACVYFFSSHGVHGLAEPTPIPISTNGQAESYR